MYQLLVAVALVLPVFAQQTTQPVRPNDKLPTAQKIDGTYTVTYAEMDGKKLDGAAFAQVTIKNNTVTCKHEGKEKSWRLEFGPHNMVRCTEQIDGKTTADTTQQKANQPADHTHHGVYIASPEYFCLCLNKGHDMRGVTSTDTRQGNTQPGSTFRFGQQEPTNANFVIILHRGVAQPSGR